MKATQRRGYNNSKKAKKKNKYEEKKKYKLFRLVFAETVSE